MSLNRDEFMGMEFALLNLQRVRLDLQVLSTRVQGANPSQLAQAEANIADSLHTLDRVLVRARENQRRRREAGWWRHSREECIDQLTRAHGHATVLEVRSRSSRAPGRFPCTDSRQYSPWASRANSNTSSRRSPAPLLLRSSRPVGHVRRLSSYSSVSPAPSQASSRSMPPLVPVQQVLALSLASGPSQGTSQHRAVVQESPASPDYMADERAGRFTH